MAVFGGQGNTENLLDELLDLDYIYQPLMRPFLRAVTTCLLEAAQDEDSKDFMTKGFDVVSWIDNAEARPPREYLFAAAVSLPLVGLIQLVNYYLTCRILHLTPGQLAQRWVATTGHSQGIVAAAVVSLSRSEDDLIENSIRALQTLFWIGLRSQQAFPEATLSPTLLADSIAHGEGQPTPMLAIANVPLADLQAHVDISNRFLSPKEQIEIALHNGPRAFVCSGPPKSLYGLNLLLRKVKASTSLDQAKIPFSERRLKFVTKFLPISSPFHCSYLSGAVDAICNDIRRFSLDLAQGSTGGASFTVPVVATDDGRALVVDETLMRSLVEQICIKKVSWATTIGAFPSTTHILDFGPGHNSGIGALTHKNVDGSGIQIVLVGTLESPVSYLQSKRQFFSSSPSSIKFGANWAKTYQPRLVRNAADGRTYVDTKFSRLLGKQPLMVAGMTPCTVNSEFVAACTNAGYHVEVAGGGQLNEKGMRSTINAIVAKVAPGSGITVNVLFINQKQWGFQFPLVQVMRSEGIPIEGFTVAAGIPSLENANEIIAALAAAGLRHVSFKPGSLEGIMQVVTIAKHNATFPIILQWTGGRAGGHHSYEDVHQPILDTYSAIRSCENICLVAGSGFGDGDGTFPYLDGSWSVNFDYPAMPFDGILLGSRLMVAKEGRASQSVKETIAKAAGVANEADWVRTYKGSAGGIITVVSELGEPIHKIATRCVLLWRELDDTVFKLPRGEKRLQYLRENKRRLMGRLNDDSHKVWFPTKKDGTPSELSEMTYDETLNRLGALLYVTHQRRWIDASYRRLFFDFLRRVEERLTRGVNSHSCVPSQADLDSNPTIDPVAFLRHLDGESPFDRDVLMTSEDCLYFVALCRRAGQKPVPFVPVFDDDFETWFKKDSLWQSEDVDAMVGQDPQRTCILQGPVAVKHSRIVDEPVKDILDSIVARHIELILAASYGGSAANVPSVPWYGSSICIPPRSDEPLGMGMNVLRPGEVTFSLCDSEGALPSKGQWFRIISGEGRNWLAALLFSDHILQDRSIVPNRVRMLFKALPGMHCTVALDESGDETVSGTPAQIALADSRGRPVVSARIDGEGRQVTIEIFYHSTTGTSTLTLYFAYDPCNGTYPIAEVMVGRNERIKRFYWSLWFPRDAVRFAETYDQSAVAAVFTSSSTVEQGKIVQFCRIVGNFSGSYTDPCRVERLAPMDFAIVVAWEAVIKCLFPRDVDGDLLKLVHLSNRISYFENTSPLAANDRITSEARVTSIKWTPSGKIVEVEGISSRDGKALLRVLSTFMYRGKFVQDSMYFEKGKELSKMMLIKTPEDLAVLTGKSWIRWNSAEAMGLVRVGSTLIFQVEYFHRNDVTSGTLSAIDCAGTILLKTDYKEYSPVAAVTFNTTTLMKKNPVLHYLERQSHPMDAPTMFEGDGISLGGQEGEDSPVNSTITTSSSNQMYSDVSGDHNPIHTCGTIADLAGLPGTITHGMWTSAAVRALVETFAAENQPLRVRLYDVAFEGMVLPKDKLRTQMRHVGMRNGRKLIRVETFNQSGTRILSGVAEVDQPLTAFVFTGQGSQEIGMGMDLYKSSKVARAIWDQADEHFFTKYGFSIIDIVRNNPKSLTVHFGGPRGQQIRDNYMSMVYETVDVHGSAKLQPLFPSVHGDSTSYTFAAPNGLLYATQFTQPALTLMEKAAYEDMRSRGLVGPCAAFGGHSLGEYAALASVGDVLSIEILCDIVFFRGLSMQVAVERDEKGRSQYGMIAVNPGRVSATFNDKMLRLLVPLIASKTARLLEIVNFNVENWQYVVAGDIVALDTLSNVLNYIVTQKYDINRLLAEYGLDGIMGKLAAIIGPIFERSCKKSQASAGVIALERGHATIPLAGIDVPFHSSFLLNGVTAFRKCLKSKISNVSVDVSILRHRYIPNLTGVPFDTSRDYVQLIVDTCASPLCKAILDEWHEEKYMNAADLQLLATTLLIELLAYQFASPVKWIESQDVIFKTYSIERLIEIGPSPVLIGMAERTLKLKYQEYDDALNQTRSLLSYAKNKAEIYYSHHSQQANAPPTSVPTLRGEEGGPTTSVAKKAKPSSAATVPDAASVESAVHAPQGRGNVSAKRYEDLPLDAIEMIRILVAIKAKKQLDEVSGSKSIKDIAGGKSTLQNEILADLQKEFGDAVPERSEELSLDDLGAHVKPSFSKAPGKHSAALIAKIFSAKMPAGFSQASVRSMLDAEFGLGARAADQIVMYALSAEPASRLASEEAAKEWLRSITRSFFTGHALPLPASGGGALSSGEGVAAISSVELDKIQAKHKRLLRQQIDLLASYVGQNLLEFHQVAAERSNELAALQKDIDLWLAEHGQLYLDGVRPMFTPLKARQYDSYWNWARQDVFLLFHDIIHGHLVNVNRDVTAKCLHVMNRSFPELVDFMESLLSQVPRMLSSADEQAQSSLHLAITYGRMLVDQVKGSLDKLPVYKDVSIHTRPQVQISYEGIIEYSEVRRNGISNFEAYVAEMRAGSSALWKQKEGEACHGGATVAHPLVYLCDRSPDDHSHWVYDGVKSAIFLDVMTDMAKNGVSYAGKTALMTGCGRDSIGSEILKGLLSGGASVIVTTSSFNRKTVEYFRAIYECHGARGSCLIVAPFNQASVQDVEALVNYIYGPLPNTSEANGMPSADGIGGHRGHGARSATSSSSLNWDLDYIVPFGAIPENGRDLTDIDEKSELAHRIMLTNVMRLFGAIARAKKERRIETRPAQAILPLSPNHGNFGGDGLYGESKLGLETLFNRWHSEAWANYISIVGAVIGWVRGTGLMNENNMIAEAMERHGIRTFSSSEMAFNILALMHPQMVRLSQSSPVYGNLNGGLDTVKSLAAFTKDIRTSLMSGAQIKRALFKERLIEADMALKQTETTPLVTPRAHLKFEYPTLLPYEKLPGSAQLRDLLDLESVVVVTGFGEVGPWGNSRTRWAMEAFGELSLEACIELAWITGLVRFSKGKPVAGGAPYTGWVDAASGEPVHDHDIKARYEERIMKHSGVRLVEPELFEGYDPNHKSLCQEVVIDYDMTPMEVSVEEAEQFKLEHGSHVDVLLAADGTCTVKLKRGARIFVPKALRFDRLVAGQIPTGWSAARYGIPQDIISQVDPLTLYVLVATVEALISAGVTDPYEFYKYVHVSEVGNTAGGGEGGMLSHRKIFRERFLDRPAASDVLQESFINTMTAWVNLLLISASGPIKTPVGACATAVESVEIGVDTILSGKARIVIVGGYDDFQEESSYEFANMTATSSATEELAKGRDPNEMSRPTATSRAGFMEAQGAGIQVLMTAALALEMGCPIYGIVALTNTAMDKEGRSIPAPGQGILTTARSVRGGGGESPLMAEGGSAAALRPRILDIEYRGRRFRQVVDPIRGWLEGEISEAHRESLSEAECEGGRPAAAVGEAPSLAPEEGRRCRLASRIKDIQLEGDRLVRDARKQWGLNFWRGDARIASIEGALAVYGLTIDDVGVGSFHGTGTKANDTNESEVVHKQLVHLGRTQGNLLPCVFQKHLTGHPKGAAAAWMLNGALQVLNSGLIPGNRNADNIDERLSAMNTLFFPSRTIRTCGVRAALLKSFGFGQVGGEVLLVHADYLYRAIDRATYEAYRGRVARRHGATYRYLHDVLVGDSTLVNVKTSPPYRAEDESAVYLNPLARAERVTTRGVDGFTFTRDKVDASSRAASYDADPQGLNVALQGVLGDVCGDPSRRGVGIDVQLVHDIPTGEDSAAFLERNFTLRERSYCSGQPDPQASFAGKWSAKEAVFKALCSAAGPHARMGGVSSPGGPLCDIEIATWPPEEDDRECSAASSHPPRVVLHGAARERFAEALSGPPASRLRVSISHSGSYAVAVALYNGSAAAVHNGSAAL